MQEFKKIFEVALSTKFSSEGLSHIVDMVLRSKNPIYELENLLGVYEEPWLPLESNGATLEKFTPKEEPSGEITYSVVEKTTRFFKTQEEADNATSQHHGHYRCSEFSPIGKEFVWTDLRTCTVDSWIKGTFMI